MSTTKWIPGKTMITRLGATVPAPFIGAAWTRSQEELEAAGWRAADVPADVPAAPVERTLNPGWEFRKDGGFCHQCPSVSSFYLERRYATSSGRGGLTLLCETHARVAGAFAEPLRGEAVVVIDETTVVDEKAYEFLAEKRHPQWCGGTEYPRTSRPVFVRAGVAFCSNECADKAVATQGRKIQGTYEGHRHGSATRAAELQLMRRDDLFGATAALAANLTRERPQPEPVRTKGRFLTAVIGGGR